MMPYSVPFPDASLGHYDSQTGLVQGPGLPCPSFPEAIAFAQIGYKRASRLVKTKSQILSPHDISVAPTLFAIGNRISGLHPPVRMFPSIFSQF
jgi:hypothetical protein